MAETQENTGFSGASTGKNGFPGDMLQKVMLRNSFPAKYDERINGHDEGGDGDMELSLGLSLNGRFGVDPERTKKKLVRSSSIANFPISGGDDNNARIFRVASHAPLPRAISLPSEAGEEWKKRKELQSQRRMEAKRRRFEKLRNVRVVGESVSKNGNCEPLMGFGASNRCAGINGGWERLPPRQPSSQGSGFSGISELESQRTQGTNKNIELRNPTGDKSLSRQLLQAPGKFPPENSTGKAEVSGNANQTVRNMCSNMPCVYTKAEGPNGKRIEGFLHSYRKGEEVRIKCVCHGEFLSPAEFVKHAGGGDVEYPLKHITVTPFPLL